MRLRKFIRETLYENFLAEGYREANEINDLATDIILFVAEKNFPLVNRISKRKNENYFFNTDTFDISEIKTNGQYPLLGTLLKSDLTFFFKENISNSFFSPKHFTIYIKHPTDDFIRILHSNIDVYENNKDPEDNSFDKDMCFRILKTSLGVAYRSIIIHELQHAFDYMRSKGKYVDDKLSKSYYGKYTHDFYDVNYKMTPEQYLKYLNMPHEYWARLSEYINSTTKLNRDFDTLFRDFKDSNIIKFDKINSPKDRNKLIKALYKVWDSKQNKVFHGSESL